MSRSPGRNSNSHHPAAAPAATHIRSTAPSPQAMTSSSSRFCGTFTGSTSGHRCGHQLGRGNSRLDRRAPAERVAESPVVSGEWELEQEVEQSDEDKSRGQIRHRTAQPVGMAQELDANLDQDRLDYLDEEQGAEDSPPDPGDLVCLWERIRR